MSLADQRCIPCHGNVSAFTRVESEDYLKHLHQWNLSEDASHIYREFTFPDFKTALAFVNHVGLLAEETGHHPEICFGWAHANIRLWTHKIGGLHQNDFILAAKIDTLPEA